MGTAATLGLVLLGPVLAVGTFLVLGPFNQGANSPSLRLMLLADMVYILAVAALVAARVVRMQARGPRPAPGHAPDDAPIDAEYRDVTDRASARDSDRRDPDPPH